MTLPDPEGPAACRPEVVPQGRPGADRLISIGDIRVLFKLGRTAAYELTHRPGFPVPVRVSSRRLRWRASEVDTYAGALQREGAQRATRRTAAREAGSRRLRCPGGLPGRCGPPAAAGRPVDRARDARLGP